MKQVVSYSLLVLIAFSVLIATARPAYGYIDPGSGFVVLQSLAAMIAGAGYFLRRRVKGLFTKETPEKDNNPANAA